VDAESLLAGFAVSDFTVALDFYRRFFGRPPDVVAHDHEVLWRVAEGGWLFITLDAARAGGGLVSVAVADLGATVAALGTRGVTAGPIEPVGDAGHKAVVTDPDGNVIALVEVARQR
jgi:predicted enzyme related to lactoylglutathione lyase